MYPRSSHSPIEYLLAKRWKSRRKTLSCVSWPLLAGMPHLILPIYLVSPCWFVTNEHIISDKAATSSSLFSSCGGEASLLESRSFIGSGDVNALCGVDSTPSCPDVDWDGEVGFDCKAMDIFFMCWCFSARRFSKVARSVVSSSSPKRPGDKPVSFYSIPQPFIRCPTGQAQCITGGCVPDNLSRLSIRPRRFSRPSMYLALHRIY